MAYPQLLTPCGCGNPTHSPLVDCPPTMNWVPCSPAWLAAMPAGACGTSLRLAGDGETVSHYHPEPVGAGERR